MAYHPDFFNKNEQSGRDRLQLDIRLDTIQKTTLSGTLLDVGCAGGYNSFALAKHFDSIYAFDMMSDEIERTKKIAFKNKANHIKFRKESLAENLSKSVSYDVILYFSTHHHIINQNGIEKGGLMLNQLFQKCKKVMFFDMGQKDERCPEHNWWQILPFDSPDIWIKEHIEKYTNIVPDKIGYTKIHNARRFLWKIER